MSIVRRTHEYFSRPSPWKRPSLLKALFRHKFSYIIAATIILVIVLGTFASFVERQSADGNIVTPEDGIWWAFVSITTVGYGDHFPVTTGGKIISAILIIVGMSFISVLTANIAAYFVEEDETNALMEINERLKRIEDDLEEQKKTKP
jgi:voltage-gated potassium channel